MSGCRIGKVKYKNSPHLAEIIPRPRGQYRERMHRQVNQICDYFPEGMAGYAIVAIGFDGTFTRGAAISPDAFFGDTLFAPIVTEILRRDIAKDIAEDVYSGRL